MEDRTKMQEEYEDILTKIRGKMPYNYTKYVRQELQDSGRFISDFQIQNVKNGRTCNLKIARILLKIAEEHGPKEN